MSVTGMPFTNDAAATADVGDPRRPMSLGPTGEPVRRLRPTFGAGVPPLDATRLERLAYRLCESLWWALWFRHGHGVSGQVPDGPFVLVADHGGHHDWLLVHHVLRRCFGRKVRFLAREEQLAHPVSGLLTRAAESVVVCKQNPAAALANALHLVDDREDARPILGVFPAAWCRLGTRFPAYCSAAGIARRCGVPIVPVALTGFLEVWPPRHKLPALRHRRELGIHFLPALNAGDFADDRTATDAAVDAIHAAVRRMRQGR
jgi:1-acyl-sn-glycerol-3-phosphate acyltransferase